MTPAEALREKMQQAGIDYAGPLVADGKLHRIRACGDRGRNSWYVLHAGPPHAGAFGCWKRDIKESWCERQRRGMSQKDWNEVRRHWHEADLEPERAERERHRKTRKIAAWILAHSKPTAVHPYPAVKGVKIFGGVREWRGALVLPLRDASVELHSLQFVGAGGAKKFLTDGRIAGCFLTLAEKPDGVLVFCEGYATGASIQEATGFTTVCAMNCGNLLPAAKALREKFPSREIILAADNDQFTDRNPGLLSARQASLAIRAWLAVPEFLDAKTKPTDFNDLHQLEGLDSVKAQINTAKPVGKNVARERLSERLPIPPLPYSPPPLHLLPSELQDYALATSDALGVDVSFILLPLLSAMGQAIGNSSIIQMKSGFVQPPIIWTGIIGRSGSKKSPALAEATYAVQERERDFIRENRAAHDLFEKQLEEWNSARPKGRGMKPFPPPRLTSLMDDLTLASVAPALVENANGIIVVKDELSHWFASFDQFHKAPGADVSRWLSLHTGVLFAFDRKTDRERYRLFNPRVCIAGGIQPKILRRCLTEEFFERGLPARFLFAWPPAQPDRWTEKTVPKKVRQATLNVFHRLFDLAPLESRDGEQQPKPWRLDADAKDEFVAFYNAVGAEAAWHKLTGYGARFTLLGELARHDGNSISGNVMRSATELARWCGAESQRTYQLLAETQEAASLRLLSEFISGRGGVVTVLDLITFYGPLKNKCDLAEENLKQLDSTGLGEWLQTPSSPKGGRPSRKFRLFADDPACLRLQSPANPLENGGIADADEQESVQTGALQTEPEASQRPGVSANQTSVIGNLVEEFV